MFPSHDRNWIKTEKGYHCKVCGKPLQGRNKLFCCAEHENYFNSNYRQIQTWNEFRYEVLKRDNYQCKKCGKNLRQQYTISHFICDHIVPLFKNGKDWWQDTEMLNFQTLCIDCNRKKTGYDLGKPTKAKQKARSLKWIFEKSTDHQLEKYISNIDKKVYAVNLA